MPWRQYWTGVIVEFYLQVNNDPEGDCDDFIFNLTRVQNFEGLAVLYIHGPLLPLNVALTLIKMLLHQLSFISRSNHGVEILAIVELRVLNDALKNLQVSEQCRLRERLFVTLCRRDATLNFIKLDRFNQLSEILLLLITKDDLHEDHSKLLRLLDILSLGVPNYELENEWVDILGSAEGKEFPERLLL